MVKRGKHTPPFKVGDVMLPGTNVISTCIQATAGDGVSPGEFFSVIAKTEKTAVGGEIYIKDERFPDPVGNKSVTLKESDPPGAANLLIYDPEGITVGEDPINPADGDDKYKESSPDGSDDTYPEWDYNHEINL